MVTYRYYCGRIALYEDNFSEVSTSALLILSDRCGTVGVKPRLPVSCGMPAYPFRVCFTASLFMLVRARCGRHAKTWSMHSITA